jgi:hypothetical protein
MLFRQHQKAMAVGPNYSGRADSGFEIPMLVAVKKEFGFGSRDVIAERGKPDVNLVVAVVDEAGRVVGYEHIDSREASQAPLDFRLLEEVVAPRLVLPGAAETSEFDAAEFVGGQVHVANRWSKRGSGVVIALYGENFLAAATGCDLEDDLVGQVAAGDKKVGLALWDAPANELVIGDDQQVHRLATVAFGRLGA